LTVGRFKPAAVINPIGEKIAAEVGIKFLAGDFKREGGEMASQRRGKELGIYHQRYCGCVYSRLGGVLKGWEGMGRDGKILEQKTARGLEGAVTIVGG
jgi:predicted adenine nucleotide alpha hydrolase (AANH) superfamily ATPase